MSILLDTDIAIYLRDGEVTVMTRIANLPAPPMISLVTLIELKGGAMAGLHRELRSRRLDTMLGAVDVLGLDEATVDVYANIIARRGFVRSRILDRLIAATAIANNLRLLTINGAHFRDIPDLQLEVWSAPAQ